MNPLLFPLLAFKCGATGLGMEMVVCSNLGETMGNTPEGFLLALVASMANKRRSRWVGFHLSFCNLEFPGAVYRMGHDWHFE